MNWLRSAFVGLLLAVLATACEAETVKTTSSLHFLALGDSYTIGEGADAADRWPDQLAARLREAGVPLAAPEIIARTGWTTGDLLDALEASTERNHYDLVSLLIGVNNQYRGHPIALYEAEFTELLDTAIALADGQPDRVLVLSIPDWGVTPFAAIYELDPETIGAQIDAFNAAARRISLERGVHFVDVTAISRLAAEQPHLLAGDGLHPSAAMYGQWVDTVYPLAFEILAGD